MFLFNFIPVRCAVFYSNIHYFYIILIYFILQKEYRKDLETEKKKKGMQVGPFTPEIQRVKRASEIASQVGVVQSLTF